MSVTIKHTTREGAESMAETRLLEKDNRIIEETLLDKSLRAEAELYKKHGIAPEVSEESHKKALKILEKMELDTKDEAHSDSADELVTQQNTDSFPEQ